MTGVVPLDCIISGHYYVKDKDQKPNVNPNKFYVKCKRCKNRILITDKGVSL